MDISTLRIPFSAYLLVAGLLPVVGLLGFYLWATPSSWKDSRRKNLPPGPKGLPFIGSFLEFADDQKVPSKAIEWGREYGDLMYMKVGGSDYIWLNTPKAVKDLMDKRSGIYSSRPPAPLCQDIASQGRRQLFMQYGPGYRIVRKISHALLNISTSTSYQPVQDYESKQLMTELLEDPDNFYLYNRRYSASVIIRVTYGFRIATFSDPLFHRIYSVLENFNSMTQPGAWLIETFPSLKVLPEFLVGNWRSYGKKVFEHDSQVYLSLWRELQEKVKNGTAPPCFCQDFMTSDLDKQGIDELQAAYQAGGLVEAGSETTSAYLNTLVRQLVLNPRVVAKAQEELDRVVGPNRLPTWEDEKNLPYIRSIIKENMRLVPPNKLGITHATSEDDWYEGHFIPKGATVVLNWWWIQYNPELYPDPHEFKPERYLSYEESAATYLNTADPYERDHFSYGAGRRVCPGIHVAEKSMFINIARMLWAFNLTQKTNPDGSLIDVDTTTEKGWMSVPNHFKCDIKVRSEKHAQIIRSTFADAEEKGLEYEFRKR